MVISTVSLKGGAGKTTIAINIAVELAHKGNNVILIDSDPNNKSCVKWSGIRSKELPKVTTVGLGDPNGLKNNITELEKHCDYVVIDGTPALAELTGIIMLVSDFIILPLRASSFDVWAFNDEFLPTFNKIRMLKPDIDCRLLVNALQEKTKITKETLEVLKDYEIEILETTIGSRTIYQFTPSRGIGVVESDVKIAKQEIQDLTEECLSIINSKVVVS